MEPVIPQSLNYASLKPEAVEHEIKLVRFTPQTNIQNQVPNDVVRFLLQGNGFFDPYSAYIRMRVDLDPDESMSQRYEPYMRTDVRGGNVYTMPLDNGNVESTVPYEGVQRKPTTVEDPDHALTFTPNQVPIIGPGGIVMQKTARQLLPDDEEKKTKLANLLPQAQMKILDRSAHSFINRMVIRSQGTEIERIEQYDVMAGIVNDMIYSNEQAQLHAYEGFACKKYQRNSEEVSNNEIDELVSFLDCHKDRDRVGEVSFGYSITPLETVHDSNTDATNKIGLRENMTANPQVYGQPDEEDFWSNAHSLCEDSLLPYPNYYFSQAHNLTPAQRELLNKKGIALQTGTKKFNFGPSNTPLKYETEGNITRYDSSFAGSQIDRSLRQPSMLNNENASIENTDFASEQYGKKRWRGLDVPTLATQAGWQNNNLLSNNIPSITQTQFNIGNQTVEVVKYGSRYVEFLIPLYSGIIGVMQPDKRLIPLSLMPLEVDLTLSPHALMCAYTQFAKDQNLTRSYKMLNFDIFAHMLFFEQNIHRSLESIVAEHGLFMHMNSFFMAPVTMNSNKAITTTVPVNLHFKSINSLHMVFMYQNYLTDITSRKLHFCSHGIRKIQLRNGVDFIPSEPLERNGPSQAFKTGSGNRFFLEMMKAWNKLHDPTTDAAIDAGFAFHVDTPAHATYEHEVDQTQMSLGTFNFKHKNDNDFNNYTSIVDNSYHKTKRISVFGMNTSIPITNGANFINSADIDNITVPIYSKQAIYANLRDFSSRVGRCCYSISLEGIALGAEKNLMTGRKGMTPFDFQLDGAKQETDPSLTVVFARSDFVVYVRPDLVVAVLGK